MCDCSIFTRYQIPDSQKKTEETEEHVYEVEPSTKQEDLYQNPDQENLYQSPDQDDQYQAAGNMSAKPFRAQQCGERLMIHQKEMHRKFISFIY